MTDTNPAPAPAPPAEEVANLHLDEVTGEKVSKTELKKRQRARQKEADKAARAAAAGPAAAAAKPKVAGEEDLNPNQYHEIRTRQISELLKTNDPNPYPHKFHVDYDANSFVKDFAHLKSGETVKDKTIRVAARIFNKRSAGSKLIFYDVKTSADTDSIGINLQVLCAAQDATGAVPFEKQHEPIRRGDIIGIVGYPGRSNPKNKQAEGKEGELSIFAQEIILLSPCLHMLPSVRFPFNDVEQRARMRYLDTLWNDRSRQILWQRSRMVQYIRNYLNERKFIEVETPILQATAGGATALPFVTHHNEHNIDMFMRIAPELFLKMMIVGQFGKVFEIGKNFRNEGVDLTHNPEFTTCEFYWAYADMYDCMDLTEELVSSMVKDMTGGYETSFTNQHGETMKVNWARPWRRVEMIPELERACDVKFPPSEELHTEATGQFLKDVLKKMKVECTPPLTNARMLDKLVGEFIEETCINPTFIMEHPQMMSPLAKYHREKKGLCERFEAFVCKKEIANSYTELNNPFDQRLRFEEQMRQKAQGDDEAQGVDETFLNALEYGLPPTGGWGLGIDRISMFLTDNYSIREVLAFPFMKEHQNAPKPKLAAELAGVEPLPVEGIAHK